MGEIGPCELVEGRIVRMSLTGKPHGRREFVFARTMDRFVEANGLGEVSVGEIGIYTGRDPDTVRAADVVFLSNERLRASQGQSYLEVPPDLVVEILSANDRPGALAKKIDEYSSAGVRSVWIADPDRETVVVHESGSDPKTYEREDELPGGAVLPGFSVPVAELFESTS